MVNLKGGAPEKFGAIRAFFYQWAAEPSLQPLHRRIASEMPIAEGRLLDVGCGPGNLDRLIASARPTLHVVGIDESEAMIRRAAKGNRLTNLEFRRGTIEGLSFRDAFDFALSVLSFHHWEEPKSGLEAVHRALKPGGRFWIYEANPEAPIEELRRDLRPLWGWLRIPERFVRKGLRGHGFTGTEVDDVVRPVVARTSFRVLEAVPSGSMMRLALTKERNSGSRSA